MYYVQCTCTRTVHPTLIIQTLNYPNFGESADQSTNIRHDIDVRMYSRVQCSHRLHNS